MRISISTMTPKSIKVSHGDVVLVCDLGLLERLCMQVSVCSG